MQKPIQVLIIEDSKVDVVLLLDEFTEGGFEPVYEVIETPEALKAALAKKEWDLIISDYSMPRFTALEAFKILQQSGLSIPFIIVSGSIGEELAVQALHLGIDDYLMKDNLTRLIPAIERELRETSQRKALYLVKEALQDIEKSYQRLVDAVKDYGIFMLDPQGRIVTWNLGAERITGHLAVEIVGNPGNVLFTEQDIQQNKFEQELKEALANGRSENEQELLRKDGSSFIAHCVLTPVHEEDGQLLGFSWVIQDITSQKQAEDRIRELTEGLEKKVQERTAQLELVNKELESFSHSVSHDLQAPLRQLIKLSQNLKHRCEQQVDEKSREYLDFILESSQKATALINDLLSLSRVSQLELKRKTINLSALVEEIARELQGQQPERKVEFRIAANVMVEADPPLLKIAMQNLLDNAWKFTSKQSGATIEFGTIISPGNQHAYFIRDNGAGFDPDYVAKIFAPFQRLHSADEFPGTGIGLATVQRVFHRHGGRVWAEGKTGQGASFYFTLP
jgi:PAS domain S-box-containing protein